MKLIRATETSWHDPELRVFVTCDSNGWVSREDEYKAPTNQELLYCWSDGDIEIDKGYDLTEPAIEGMSSIIGWQPMIKPMEHKPSAKGEG